MRAFGAGQAGRLPYNARVDGPKARPLVDVVREPLLESTL